MQATAHFVFWTILLQTLIGFALAYLIDRKFRGHGFWTTVILIPMMLSPAVVGNFWKFLYQPQIGLFNYVGRLLLRHSDPSSFEMLGSCQARTLGDHHRRYLDVDALCDADLPRGAALDSRLHLRGRGGRPRAHWRQFWSITLPMALPFIMLAVLFRGIENFKMFDMVNLLTSGGPGSTTEVASITLEARGVREMAHRLLVGLRHHPVRHGVRPCQHLCEGAQPGEAAMTSHRQPIRSSRQAPRRAASPATIVILYALVSMVPLVWIFLTSIKTPPNSISYPPKVLFQPSLEGYCNLFTTRSRQTAGLHRLAAAGREPLRRRCALAQHGGGRTVELRRRASSTRSSSPSARRSLSVLLGTAAAYAFSRFKVPLKDDLLFFILSTRMMPPIAVAIPIYLMYRELGLSDTKLGMILLYTAVNVVAGRLAAQGVHRRDPARIRGSRNGRRLHPPAGLLQGGAAAGHDRHRRDRDLLPDLRLERIRLRGPAHLRRGADRAAVHPDHHRRGRTGLAGGGGRHDDRS